jgi:hypothetical protein
MEVWSGFEGGFEVFREIFRKNEVSELEVSVRGVETG